MPDSLEVQRSRDDENSKRPSSNAATGRRRSSRTGSYDSWTVPELRKRAKELGMSGYSALSKSDLIYELRKN